MNDWYCASEKPRTVATSSKKTSGSFICSFVLPLFRSTDILIQWFQVELNMTGAARMAAPVLV
jgi:hypothetical protein